jgi:excinuclease ABC subunit A
LVIEHNTDVIRSADWVIELGPEAGSGGGELVFAGTPKELKKSKRSRTAPYLGIAGISHFMDQLYI